MIIDYRTSPEWIPCRIFDANGLEIDLVRWCDTDTGEATRMVKGPDGQIVVDEDCNPVTATEKYAPPLLVVKMDKPAC